jgi:hypothetical protein
MQDQEIVLIRPPETHWAGDWQKVVYPSFTPLDGSNIVRWHSRHLDAFFFGSHKESDARIQSMCNRLHRELSMQIHDGFVEVIETIELFYHAVQ